MILSESFQITRSLLDKFYKEYLIKSNLDPITYPLQVKDSRSHVFFKYLGEQIASYNANNELTVLNRYELNTIKANEKYGRRVDKNTSLKSKAFALIDKDKSDYKRSIWLKDKLAEFGNNENVL